MTFRNTASEVMAAGLRQAHLAKLQIEAHRLEAKIDAEKDAIGHALFPLLESKVMSVDVPEVNIRVRAISELYIQLAAKRAEVDAAKRPQPEAAPAQDGPSSPPPPAVA